MTQIGEYQRKFVQGLYSFDHFQAPDGSFIQVHASGTYWIYQDARGDRQTCYSMVELKQALAK